MGLVERDDRSGETFRRIVAYLRPHRLRIVIAVLLIVVSTIASLLAPWLVGVGIDEFIAEQDRDGLRVIVGLLVLCYFVSWSASMLYSRSLARIAQQAMAQMRKDLSGRLQTLSMRFFDRNRTGDLMSRVTNDVDAIDQMLSQNLTTIVWSALQVISLIIIMLTLDWRLTLAVLLPLPFSIGLVGRIGKASGPRFGAYQRSIGELNAEAEERLGAQRTVIALHRQADAERTFEELNERTRASGISAQTLTSVMMPIMFGMGSLSTVSVIGIGGWLAVSERGVTVGLIASFITYASRVGHPFGRIAQTMTTIYAALAGGRRVFELIDEEPDLADAPDAVPLPPVVGRVEFRNVDFEYDEGEPILNNISFVAEPGQMIGLVGPTGAGKSTIINVLNRFYDIRDGSVTIDGHDIREVTRDSLRDQLGIVLQRTYLFTDTVRANIRFGRLDATDADVEAAARLANAHHFIMALPQGYETVVSEGGTNLSLGQRQLLAIARAALADPKLLVLDEATSSVDTRTERDLQSALLSLMEDRTSFVIAHRLSTVRHADQILVIRDGRISEQGTHDELIRLGGFYNELHAAQFRGQRGR